MATTLAETAALLDRRTAHAEATVASRAARVRAALPAVATCLMNEFGATRVWLFGSLAMGPVHAESDLDLAVEGLAPLRYFEALAAVSQLVDVDVDLVRVEEVSERLRSRIELEGHAIAG